MNLKMSNIRSILSIGVSVSIIIIFSQMSIPVGIIPVTMQTLVIGIISLVHSPKESFSIILSYISLGSLGFPIFANGKGGVSIILGPTGGYLLMFLLIAPLLSVAMQVFKNNIINMTLICIIFYEFVLFGGMIWLKFVTGSSWENAFFLGFLSFTAIEAVKAIFIVSIAFRLKKIKYKVI